MKKVFQVWYDYNLDWLYNTEEVNDPKDADILLFWGGTDVNPEIYGEKKGRNTQQPDIARDAFESMLFEEFPNKIKIGVCRGSQFLTALNGGKLIQDVSQHGINHHINIDFKGNNYKEQVTSSHHQMMYPYDLPDTDYEVIGYSVGRSTKYRNGDNKSYINKDGVELREVGNFIEPEIVWYPKTTSLCIQSHPEWQDKDHAFVKLLNEIINELCYV